MKCQSCGGFMYVIRLIGADKNVYAYWKCNKCGGRKPYENRV